jgi:hypothetical protein
LYPGDEVKSTYTKDMSNVTYGVWTLRVDVKRGAEGITAGATNVVHSEMWDGWRGGFHCKFILPGPIEQTRLSMNLRMIQELTNFVVE